MRLCKYSVLERVIEARGPGGGGRWPNPTYVAFCKVFTKPLFGPLEWLVYHIVPHKKITRTQIDHNFF